MWVLLVGDLLGFLLLAWTYEDVVAGWCFGLAWLAACLLVRSHIAERVSSVEP